MKQLLKELGFEELPMLSDYLPKCEDYWSKSTNTLEGQRIGYHRDTIDYRDFITQPLTKGMFIPCSEDGEVLTKPKRDSFHNNPKGDNLFTLYTNRYQQAKDRVLFTNDSDFAYNNEFSEIDYELIANKYITIEQAINNGVKLILI